MGTQNADQNAESNERTSLLPSQYNQDEDDSRTQSIEETESGDVSKWRLIWTEFKILLAGSIPVIVAYTLQMSLQTISVAIVGRRSPNDLAAAAFAYMFAMVTGWLIALGGSTAMDTLASSAFTGSKNPHEVGVLLQKAFLVLGLFYIPVVIIWIFAEPLFLALGQDPRISHDSARFLQCLIPGGLGYVYFECLKKYLQAQGESFPLLPLRTC